MSGSQSRNAGANGTVEFECGPVKYEGAGNCVPFKDIHLKFNSPHLSIITGPSGCGKTTLLKIIAGLKRARVGTRRINKKTYGERELDEWRSRCTLLLQDAPVIEGTVLDNLSFPFEFNNSGHKEFQKEEAKRHLDELGLCHVKLNQDARLLSGGERHRLCLARALLWSPPVLLMDEPFSGLEPELQNKCFDKAMEFSRNRPAIVICVLHEKDFFKRADSCWRLEDGSLHRTWRL